MTKTQLSFNDLKLNKQLLTAIENSGFSSPTPVQQKVIPLVMAGHDIIGIAQTGTGKTAAYLLPILMKLKFHQEDGPRALIFAPTRELAIQINEHIKGFSQNSDLRHCAIYGGSGTKLQKEMLVNGVDILVATPGRFMDFYLEQVFPSKFIKTLVLDEADKMMDMGFMPQIRRILEIVPRKRQNLLFSATMPARVAHLSDEFLEFPMTIEISPQASTVELIEQRLYEVPNFKSKINMLNHLLENEDFNRVIVFVKTKVNANNIYSFIKRKITKSVRVIHGNKDQNARINAINDFKKGEVRVLVTTDVVARGIDVSMVSHVINFDVPLIYEDYVHRVGRTGRAEQLGVAITFMNEAEKYHVGEIEKLIGKKIPQRKISSTVQMEKTSFDESQEMKKEMDHQKQISDPSFRGAFHDKKEKKRKYH
ncbi:MAG: DEAD/DEAH box helicase [Bacteroidetes bacterium]|nr:DEAD/DEAH box helicase [Bacteroidota bacterium]MDA1121282.1 DEAD/DEAH box helicase [Bacteroidota bacterium]